MALLGFNEMEPICTDADLFSRKSNKEGVFR